MSIPSGRQPIAFDPSDPFPHLNEPVSYSAAKEHARLVDAWLGLDTERREREISANPAYAGETQRPWIGLPVESLLTPYIELRDILHRLDLPPGARLVDLGAGYGRLGFVVARHGNGVRFRGFELVAERVREGREALRRFGVSEDIADLEVADLADPAFPLPEADAYFIYDFGSRAAVEKMLGDLRAYAARLPITVVGRGRLTRDAIEQREPWLSQVAPPEHCGNFSIYRSAIPGKIEK